MYSILSMYPATMKKITFLSATLALLLLAPFHAHAEVDFSKDVLPILSNNCFQCHGPDAAQRAAELRLDVEEGAFAELPSGEFAVVKGKPDHSALLHRITEEDPELRMPPADSGKSLTEKDKEVLRQWIEQGASWNEHWAYVPPQLPALPKPVNDWKQSNAIDLFIQARLQQQGLSPEKEADKATLIRRLTLDLTGLPPSVAEVDAFLADASDQAYERLVDRLLQSERYGEHMARNWLDAARFADTHGLHLDNERSIWPYRDWVIKSFNQNMPFDQFTVEQLAGDLLPEPSLSQRVATGFNRCNVTTSEGGSIDEEYYVRYAVDRVETTATVWMGLTAGCAACHDHKFDPLSQKEFYQLFSYFFSLTERAMDGNALLPPPSVKVPTKEHSAEKARLTSESAAANQTIATILENAEYKDPFSGTEFPNYEKLDAVWFDDELPEGAKPEGNTPWSFVSSPDHPVFSGENSTTRTGDGITQHFFTGAKNGPTIAEGTLLYCYVFIDEKNPPESIQLQFNDGSWEHRATWGADKCFGAGRDYEGNRRQGELPEKGKWVRLEVAAADVGLKPGAKLNGWAFTQFGGTVNWDQAGSIGAPQLSVEQKKSLAIWEHYQTTVGTSAPDNIKKIFEIKAEERNENQIAELRRYYIENVNPDILAKLAEPKKKAAELKKSLDDLEKAIPATLVMEDRKEMRVAHILERGEYDKKGEPVESAVPAWLGAAPKDAPKNRMGLAQWLVNPQHPLTSRVTVNRYWQHYFGTGLVKTSEDFGVQGEQPSHPALLDWLALRFIESGWDVKEFQKLIVMSSTYKQSSRVTSEKLAIDPQNRLLARGSRFRLDAEVIRDQVLQISGLLVGTIGGKSVKPYQPAGLWKPVGFGGSNTATFRQDSGDALFRRSMYTFWKRTSPPPSMSIFDAPDRETCQVRRARTNTPLQALVLLNDVQFVEAARRFAEQVVREGGDSVEAKISFVYRSVLAREPSAKELQIVSTLFDEHLAEFTKNPEAANQLLAVGESVRDEMLDSQQLGAWTMIVHLVFNLSETVTKG